ncbi:hypothetical protein D3C80_440220 [compost metagenome]
MFSKTYFIRWTILYRGTTDDVYTSGWQVSRIGMFGSAVDLADEIVKTELNAIRGIDNEKLYLRIDELRKV